MVLGIFNRLYDFVFPKSDQNKSSNWKTRQLHHKRKQRHKAKLLAAKAAKEIDKHKRSKTKHRDASLSNSDSVETKAELSALDAVTNSVREEAARYAAIDRQNAELVSANSEREDKEVKSEKNKKKIKKKPIHQLMAAISRIDLPIFIELLCKHQGLVNSYDRVSKKTLLIAICDLYADVLADEEKCEDLSKMAVLLIGAGADVNARIGPKGLINLPDPDTRADLALKIDGMKKNLIANSAAKNWTSALKVACSKLCPRLVHLLLANGADFDEWEFNDMLPLYEDASSQNHEKSVVYQHARLSSLIVIAKMLFDHKPLNYAHLDKVWNYREWLQQAQVTFTTRDRHRREVVVTQNHNLFDYFYHPHVLAILHQFKSNLITHQSISLEFGMGEQPTIDSLLTAITNVDLQSVRLILVSRPELANVLEQSTMQTPLIVMAKKFVAIANNKNTSHLDKKLRLDDLLKIANLLLACGADINHKIVEIPDQKIVLLESANYHSPLSIACKSLNARLVHYLLHNAHNIATLEDKDLNALLPMYQDHPRKGRIARGHPAKQRLSVSVIFNLLANAIRVENDLRSEWFKWASQGVLHFNQNGIILSCDINFVEQAKTREIEEVLQQYQHFLKFQIPELGTYAQRKYLLRVQEHENKLILKINRVINNIIHSSFLVYGLYTSYQGGSLNPAVFYVQMMLKTALMVKDLYLTKQLDEKLKQYQKKSDSPNSILTAIANTWHSLPAKQKDPIKLFVLDKLEKINAATDQRRAGYWLAICQFFLLSRNGFSVVTNKNILLSGLLLLFAYLKTRTATSFIKKQRDAIPQENRNLPLPTLPAEFLTYKRKIEIMVYQKINPLAEKWIHLLLIAYLFHFTPGFYNIYNGNATEIDPINFFDAAMLMLALGQSRRKGLKWGKELDEIQAVLVGDESDDEAKKVAATKIEAQAAKTEVVDSIKPVQKGVAVTRTVEVSPREELLETKRSPSAARKVDHSPSEEVASDNHTDEFGFYSLSSALEEDLARSRQNFRPRA